VATTPMIKVAGRQQGHVERENVMLSEWVREWGSEGVREWRGEGVKEWRSGVRKCVATTQQTKTEATHSLHSLTHSHTLSRLLLAILCLTPDLPTNNARKTGFAHSLSLSASSFTHSLTHSHSSHTHTHHTNTLTLFHFVSLLLISPSLRCCQWDTRV
jgi:hypothetical protein